MAQKKTTEFVFCNLHRNQPDLSSYANYLTGNAFRCHNRTHHLKEVCYIIAYIDIVVTAKTGVMKFLPSFRLLDHLTSLEKAFWLFDWTVFQPLTVGYTQILPFYTVSRCVWLQLCISEWPPLVHSMCIYTYTYTTHSNKLHNHLKQQLLRNHFDWQEQQYDYPTLTTDAWNWHRGAAVNTFFFTRGY